MKKVNYLRMNKKSKHHRVLKKGSLESKVLVDSFIDVYMMVLLDSKNMNSIAYRELFGMKRQSPAIILGQLKEMTVNQSLVAVGVPPKVILMVKVHPKQRPRHKG